MILRLMNTVEVWTLQAEIRTQLQLLELVYAQPASLYWAPALPPTHFLTQSPELPWLKVLYQYSSGASLQASVQRLQVLWLHNLHVQNSLHNNSAVKYSW